MPEDRLSQQVVRLADFKKRRPEDQPVLKQTEEEKSLGQLLLEEIIETKKHLTSEEEKLFEQSESPSKEIHEETFLAELPQVASQEDNSSTDQ